MPTTELTFDAEAHAYKLDGSPLPSVTQVIRAVLPGWQASEWYLQRGRALHHGCRLLDEGRLNWNTVSPEIEPRITAWLHFRADWKATPILAEKPMAHSLYRYAGTPDRVFDRDDRLTVCDLKSSIEPQVKLQLGAYSLLWAHQSQRKISQAVAVQLNDDGTYRTLWLNAAELRKAELAFLATLTVYGFMQQHRLRGER